MRYFVLWSIVFVLLFGCNRQQVPGSSVVFVVDASKSISRDLQRSMLKFVNERISQDGQADEDRRVGLIAFGVNASIEIPLSRNPPKLSKLETEIDPTGSNLEAAIYRALAVLPPDGERRIVVLTDGNETIGNAMTAAEAAVAKGVAIDVVPIEYEKSDVAVEKLSGIRHIQVDQPFEIRVQLSLSDRMNAVHGTLYLREEKTVA